MISLLYEALTKPLRVVELTHDAQGRVLDFTIRHQVRRIVRAVPELRGRIPGSWSVDAFLPDAVGQAGGSGADTTRHG